jgi:hypothetical protein
VNRKVTVPVSGLLIRFASSSSLWGHYSSGGYYRPFTLPLFTGVRGIEILGSLTSQHYA